MSLKVHAWGQRSEIPETATVSPSAFGAATHIHHHNVILPYLRNCAKFGRYRSALTQAVPHSHAWKTRW
jgi:hypothetical protein